MEDGSNRSKKKKHSEDPTTSSSSTPSSSSSDDDERSSKRHKRSHTRRREDKRRSDGSSRREKDDKRRERDRKKNKKRERRDRERKHRASRREGKRKVSDMETNRDSDSKSRVEPEGVVRFILKEFPGVAADLEQLLQMIDGGQAVDISGLSQKSLVKHLKKLFQSLNLIENGNQIFLLSPNVCPTLEIVGPIIHSQTESRQQQSDYSVSPNNIHSAAPDEEHRQEADHNTAMPHPNGTADAPRRRAMGIVKCFTCTAPFSNGKCDLSVCCSAHGAAVKSGFIFGIR